MLPLYCNLFAEVQINQPSEAAASGRADRRQWESAIQAITARCTEFLIEWVEMRWNVLYFLYFPSTYIQFVFR